MKVAPLHWVEVNEHHPDAPPGVYVHAREVAAWLRDNDLDEAAADLDALAGEAEAQLAA